MKVAFPSIIVFVLLLAVDSFSLNNDGGSFSEEEEEDGYMKLVEWMISHGGRVDSRMVIGEVDGIRGVVAVEDIAENTELLFCPWKLVIGSSSLEDQMSTEQDMCDVVQIMASEIRLGSNSVGYPYLDHIELPRLGSMWGPEAVTELQGLSPSYELNRHNMWFSQTCDGGSIEDFDDATTQSLISFISRASAVGMIPIYDLLNHHNGFKNAKLYPTKDGVQLRTVRRVDKDEQLYLSYGLKESSQMYRDYGFVEAWPRLWSWKDVSTQDNHVFALFPDGVAAIHPSMDFLKQIWSSSFRTVTEWQELATQYTQNEVGTDSLMHFTTAAKKLLERLPSTWIEDEELLIQKQTERTSLLSTAQDETLSVLEDVIAAIRYRIEFKKGVVGALLFAEGVLDNERMGSSM